MGNVPNVGLLACIHIFTSFSRYILKSKHTGSPILMDSLLFQNGELSLQDFRFIVAHPDILPELVSIRGLMKRKFPNQKSGTLKQGKEWNTVVSDVHTVKLTFRHWASYTCKKGIPLPLSNCILYIQSTNILTEFFETCCTICFFFSSQNAVYFILLSFFGSYNIHILDKECTKI